MFWMSGLTAFVTRPIGLLLFRRFDNIRRWQLGRVRGILRKFSDFISQLGHPFGQFSVFLDKGFIDGNKSGNLFFKFGNASNIEWFFFRS